MIVKNIFELNVNDVVLLKDNMDHSDVHVIACIDYNKEIMMFSGSHQPVRFLPNIFHKLTLNINDETENDEKFEKINLNS